MLNTGMLASAASSATSPCGPVRTPTAWTWRDSTRAVSPIDSPRESWSSPERSSIGWPPSSTTPASNDRRVRVEGRSKTSATTRPSRACDERGAVFSSAARSSSRARSPESSSSPVRKCRVKSGTLSGMQVLTWNLFHGRAVPNAGRDLERDYAAKLASWAWDVALLQEVPPWWPAALAGAAGARDPPPAPPSPHAPLPPRRAIAQRWPAVIKSNGGGCNAILVREGRIAEHRVRLLRRLPERRVVHAVRLDEGSWVANVHTQVPSAERACADIAGAASAVLGWAGDAPVVFGGDLNVRDPGVVAGFTRAAGHGVDHVLARGLKPVGKPRVLDRGPLSDHAPVLVELQV